MYPIELVDQQIMDRCVLEGFVLLTTKYYVEKRKRFKALFKVILRFKV